MCTHVGDPTVLAVSGGRALVNDDLDDGVALLDPLAAAALASLVPMRAVVNLDYLEIEVSTRDKLPDVGCTGRTRTLRWGRRPPLLRQW